MFGGLCKKRVNYICNPLFLEAIAFDEGIKFALAKGVNKVIIEGDAQIVVEALNCNKLDNSYLKLLIDDIKERSKELEEVTFSWIPRCCNLVANNLARGEGAVYYGSDILPGSVLYLILS